VHAVSQHWRGISQGVLVAGGAILAGGCIAITVGACSVPLVEAGVVVGTGALVSSGLYGISGGSHDLNGYLDAAGEGAIGGVLGVACASGGGIICGSAVGAGLAGLTVGMGTGAYDYATTTPDCNQTIGGYLEAALRGGLENLPFDPRSFGATW
jgi:hypothetical protein